MSKAEYKRLGDYIREVNVRNRDLKVTNLLGVNLSKQFFPSIANIIGTDLSKYKMIEKGQFGCKFMSVGRDGILPISLMQDDTPAIISSAYYVFEVKDQEVLLPEYLMMWLRRPEFDRQLWFYSGGDVRGGVNYDDFCEMPIIIPSITRQLEIVSQYETLTNRIRLNNQMIQHLEATAQALYRKTFVDNIDKEKLPEGWRMGTLGEVAKIVTGKLNSEDAVENGMYPFFTCSQETYRTNSYAFDQEAVLLAGNNASAIYPLKIYKGKFNAYQRTYVISSLHQTVSNKHLYYAIKDKLEEFKGSSQGTTTKFLTIKILDEIPIIIPNVVSFMNFSPHMDTLYNNLSVFREENEKLTELQSLLLAKMGQ
jgi:type I restriction enzyme S subunit